MNQNPKNAVATAIYIDMYFGPVRAHLVTFKTTRKQAGGRCEAYRWQTERGSPMLTSMLTPNALLNRAANHAQFEHVAALVSARGHFIPGGR